MSSWPRWPGDGGSQNRPGEDSLSENFCDSANDKPGSLGPPPHCGESSAWLSGPEHRPFVERADLKFDRPDSKIII